MFWYRFLYVSQIWDSFNFLNLVSLCLLQKLRNFRCHFLFIPSFLNLSSGILITWILHLFLYSHSSLRLCPFFPFQSFFSLFVRLDNFYFSIFHFTDYFSVLPILLLSLSTDFCICYCNFQYWSTLYPLFLFWDLPYFPFVSGMFVITMLEKFYDNWFQNLYQITLNLC